MNFTTFNTTRPINLDELCEVLQLVEYQQTTDRFTNTSITINGEHAEITVNIDEEGNILLI